MNSEETITDLPTTAIPSTPSSDKVGRRFRKTPRRPPKKPEIRDQLNEAFGLLLTKKQTDKIDDFLIGLRFTFKATDVMESIFDEDGKILERWFTEEEKNQLQALNEIRRIYFDVIPGISEKHPIAAEEVKKFRDKFKKIVADNLVNVSATAEKLF